MKRFLTLFVILIALTSPLNVANTQVHIPEPVPPPPAIRAAFDLSPFYQQWIDIDGFPILASTQVSSYAVKEVAWLIHQITRHRPAVLQAMVENKVRFSIIGHNERTTEIPEHRRSYPDPHFWFDVRNRGGYCPRCKTVSTSEEAVLDEGWYSVTIHEFAHAFHEAGLNTIDPTFDDRLRTTYTAAMARGLWQNTYASTNFSEYWAQGVGTWFNANPQFQSATTREALKNYDPDLASLLTETFGDRDWQYTLPKTRTHSPHLRGFDPQEAPKLKHPPELLETWRQFTGNPDNDGGGEWVTLQPYPPSQLPRLNRSRTIGDLTISVYFMNHTGTPVSVYYVKPDGEEVYDINFIPGNFNELGASIGEILLVKDDTGKNIAVFFVDKITPGSIVRIFVGTPKPIPTTGTEIAIEKPPVKAPTTGTYLAVDKPPELAENNFTIGPGEFAILAHNGRHAVVKQADFKTYTAYWGLGNNSRDIPNLVQFFQNGGRIELISHATANPLPSGSSEAQFGDLVLSEIMWGLDDTSPAKQYIELYNASAHAYTFTNADVNLRFSTVSEEPLPNEVFAPPFNPNARVKVIDRVSNNRWRVPGKNGNISQNKPLISMYRTIDYTTGDIPDGTLASSWKASTGRVNLSAPSFGTPGARHLPPRPVVSVAASQRPPMYWIDADAGTLHRLINDTVENFLPNVQNATSLAVDMDGGKLYWTEKTGNRAGRIRRANLDGSNVKLVKTLTSVPHGIALDAADSKIYVTNAYEKVQRLNVDGSNFQSNLITELNIPNDIVVDSTGSKIYWTEQTSERRGRIRQANLDGSNVQLVKALTSVPFGMALDPSRHKLYVTNAYGKVQKLSTNGSDFQPNLITGLDTPKDVAVDVAHSKVYWTEKGSIRRADLNGADIQDVVTGLGSPGSIVLGTPSMMPVERDTPTEPVTDASTDVNQDKKVNKTDLLLVVTALGETPPTNPNFDVNADGTVNIADVLLVIEDLDDPVAAAAPALGETVTFLDPGRLAMQIDILRAESDGSMKYEHAIAFFQSLLAAIRPTETRLLANYPNPFNPETWIPYELATDTEVTLTIYNTQGIVVRVLHFGQQAAGYYTDRQRAAYWDGRNALGEQVASGIYFYQLETDEMSSLRKMVILK